MQYRLRTLMVLLALLPPLLAGGYWAYWKWRDSMLHMELDPSGEVVRMVERPSGRVRAEFHVGHVSLGTDR